MNLYEMFEESKDLTLIDALRDFLPIAIEHLKLKKLPKITFTKNLHNTHVPTFGRFANDSKVITLDIENRHPVDIIRTLAHELTHYAQGERGELDDASWHTGSPEENEANAEAGIMLRKFNSKFSKYLKLPPVVLSAQVNEKWSAKYKRSIDCSNPKGFSQRAHCQGRKKHNEDVCDTHRSPSGRMTNMCPDDDDYEINYGKKAMGEGFMKNAAVIAALASALASGTAMAEPSATAQAIGIVRKINRMQGYGAAGLQGEAHQEMMNILRAVEGHPNQSKLYPIIKDLIKDKQENGTPPIDDKDLPPLISPEDNR